MRTITMRPTKDKPAAQPMPIPTRTTVDIPPPEGVLPPGVGAGLQPHSEKHMVINAVEVSAAKCMGRYHAPPTLGHNQNPSSLLL